MSRYAENTSVSVEKSRAELERTLMRYGADEFVSGIKNTADAQVATIGFRVDGRSIRMVLRLPSRSDRQFTHTPSRGVPRSPAQAEAAWEAECRRSWRALNLVTKAKLEAVESGISTFDDEFLAHFVLPGGRTVSEQLTAQVLDHIQSGGRDPLPLLGPAPDEVIDAEVL